jgi:hypothetical protein
VVVKAVITAVNGPEVAWGKLDRQGSVAMEGPMGGRAKKGSGEVGAAKPRAG